LQPGEFRDVDAPGGNIKDQFQFLPFKGPDQTLFQLLNFCVESGRRFASIADMKVSDMNAQSPVGTTMAILERGSKVMSAIHKRCYYAMRQEFKMLASVFADYLPPEYPYDVVGGNRFIKQEDFDDRIDVIPVADPDIYSMTQRIQVAQAELQLAQSNPAMHDVHEAYKRMYQALGVKNINGILKPPPEPPKPLDPAIENTGALQMIIPKAFPQQDHEAHIQAHMAFMTSRMVQVNPQIYGLLQGHIMEHVSLQSKQEVLQQFNQNPAMVEMQTADEEAFTIEFDNAVAKRIAQRIQELVAMEQQFTAQQNKDPLLALKQKELDLRAMDIQRKATEEAQKMDFETNKFSAQQTLAEDKLNLNEELGRKRIELQEEKMEQENNNDSER
ncbi:MAG: portal protein, partial [Candidatus Actinomarinaceae bacterium]